ncbi:MAG: hypothetical protein RI897_3049 [Verrucomicrobiota bacterium]
MAWSSWASWSGSTGGLADFLDADALHLDTGGGFTVFPAAAGSGGCSDLFEDVIAIHQLAEGGVLAIEELGIAMADEELGSGGVRVLGAGHGDDPADVGFLVELGFDFVAGAAGAEDVFLGGVFGIGVTALNHEAFDDAVEAGAVVEAFGGQFLEILDGFGGDIGPEVQSHIAHCGFD